MELFTKNRVTKRVEKELIYGGSLLFFLYHSNPLSFLLSRVIAFFPFLSKLYGFFQKIPCSKKKILPFIKKYHINAQEFQQPVENFSSFNDFFCRKLKPEARPISAAEAIIPTDGRFLVYPTIEGKGDFIVKGQKFCLEKLLGSRELALEYARGSMVLGRLAPVDYHRFHFPFDCTPSEPQLLPGPLFSVNPIAVRKRVAILSQNKRMLTILESRHFGTVLSLEIGATYVGTIHETFIPGKAYRKGEEKGFFSFGGSALILLFLPNTIAFDQDLIEASCKPIEMRSLLGQSMGRAI